MGLPLFAVGDRVRWTSQSNARRSTKHGRVACIVPARMHPLSMDITRPLDGYDITPMRDCGCANARPAISYLVAVAPTARHRKERLYWPLAKYLIKEEPPCTPTAAP